MKTQKLLHRMLDQGLFSNNAVTDTTNYIRRSRVKIRDWKTKITRNKIDFTHDCPNYRIEIHRKFTHTFHWRACYDSCSGPGNCMKMVLRCK